MMFTRFLVLLVITTVCTIMSFLGLHYAAVESNRKLTKRDIIPTAIIWGGVYIIIIIALVTSYKL